MLTAELAATQKRNARKRVTDAAHAASDERSRTQFRADTYDQLPAICKRLRAAASAELGTPCPLAPGAWQRGSRHCVPQPPILEQPPKGLVFSNPKSHTEPDVHLLDEPLFSS